MDRVVQGKQAAVNPATLPNQPGGPQYIKWVTCVCVCVCYTCAHNFVCNYAVTYYDYLSCVQCCILHAAVSQTNKLPMSWTFG
jgi:hypothetical protein